MKQQLIKITPVGEMFFRDTMNMTMGESNWIISNRIPSLSVFYGALTSMQLREGKFVDVLELIKEANKEKNKDIRNKKQQEIDQLLKSKIKIHGIYLADETNLYMPTPLDLFLDEDYRIKLGEDKEDGIYIPEEEYYNDDEEWHMAENTFISLKDYMRYRKNEGIKNIRVKQYEEFFDYYHKVGISRKEDRTIEEGKLYFTDMVSFKNKEMGYVLQVECEDFEVPEEGKLIQLGGERKTAIVKNYSNRQWKRLEEKNQLIERKDKVKLIFTASFVLAEGKEEIFEKSQITILNSAIGKLDYVGGYNMAISSQKEIRKAIPAGSVFILDISKCQEEDLYSYIRKNINIGENDKKFISFLLQDVN